MDKTPVRIGKAVRVMKSNHPDIKSGDSGIITNEYQGGFGVEIQGPFKSFGATVPDKSRIFWFAENCLKALQ